MSRMRMITPVTARNGVEVTKLGIRTCSFIGDEREGGDNDVAAGHAHDSDRAAWRDLGVRGGGEVVRATREADQHGAEAIRGDSDRDAPGRSDHLLEPEGVRRLGLLEDLESAEHDTGAKQPGHDAGVCRHRDACAEAMKPKKAADAEHGEESEQHRRRRYAGNVKAEMDGSQHAAEYVVENQGEQQESAPRQEADAKDQIGDVQSTPTSA